MEETALTPSPLEEEPIRMAMTPFGLAVGILLKHHSEPDAGFLVAMLAKVAKADHLCLTPVLCHEGRTAADHQHGDSSSN